MPHRPFPSLRRAPFVAAVAAVGLAVGVSACGSSDSSSTATQSANAGTGQGQGGPGRFAQDPKVVACLKKEGVTLPSFPGRGGGAPPQGQGTTPVPPLTGTTTSGTPAPGNGYPGTGPRRRSGQRPNFNSAQFQKMQAALKKCGVTFGRGGPGRGPGYGQGNGQNQQPGQSTTGAAS